MSTTCRADCGEPLSGMDDTGLHPTCRAPVQDMLPTLRAILARHQGAMPRSRQVEPGPSQLGEPCDRAMAYRLAEVAPPRPYELKWAPLLGTWTHAGLAEALRQENERLGRERYLIERQVVVSRDPRIVGTVDCYDVDVDEVIDWKLVSAASIARKRKLGPGRVYRTQVHAYGLGWRNAGMSPRSVRIVLLPKSALEVTLGYEWSEPFDATVATDALSRMRGLQQLTKVLDLPGEPQNWPLVRASPDAPEDCKWCDWRRDEWLPYALADHTGCPGVD